MALVPTSMSMTIRMFGRTLNAPTVGSLTKIGVLQSVFVSLSNNDHQLIPFWL